MIEEANWLTLTDDIPGQTFDAVICLGNSFAHMPDNTGDQRDIRYANNNRQRALKLFCIYHCKNLLVKIC